MAFTVALSCDNSSVSGGQPVAFVATITNLGATAVNVTRVTPYFSTATGAAIAGTSTLHPGTPVQVAGSNGTKSFAWKEAFFAGLQPTTSGTRQTAYTCKCIVETDEGSITTETSPVVVQVTPMTDPNIPMPQTGQFRFDSNLNSGLFAVLMA